MSFLDLYKNFHHLQVSHIILDRVNGINYDLGDKSENLRRMNHFEKFNKVNRIFFAENARFFEY